MTTKYIANVALVTAGVLAAWFNSQEKISRIPQAARLYERIDRAAATAGGWRASEDLRREVTLLTGASGNAYWIFAAPAILAAVIHLPFLPVAFSLVAVSGLFVWGGLEIGLNPRQFILSWLGVALLAVLGMLVLTAAPSLAVTPSPSLSSTVAALGAAARSEVFRKSALVVLASFVVSGGVTAVVSVAIGRAILRLILATSRLMEWLSGYLDKKLAVAWSYVLVGVIAMVRVLIG